MNKENQELIRRHHEGTMFCSFDHHMREVSPTYKEIIKKGKSIVTDVLLYLRAHKDAGMSTMLLLWDILKTSPYEPEQIAAGFVAYDVDGARAAWLVWGSKENLIPMTDAEAKALVKSGKKLAKTKLEGYVKRIDAQIYCTWYGYGELQSFDGYGKIRNVEVARGEWHLVLEAGDTYTPVKKNDRRTQWLTNGDLLISHTTVHEPNRLSKGTFATTIYKVLPESKAGMPFHRCEDCYSLYYSDSSSCPECNPL